MEYTLDLLSSVAFLLSESGAEREKAKGGVGIMEMEEEGSYSIWLL